MNFGRNCDRNFGKENVKGKGHRGYAPDPISHSGTPRIPLRDENGAKFRHFLATCAIFDSALHCNVHCDIIFVW